MMKKILALTFVITIAMTSHAQRRGIHKTAVNSPAQKADMLTLLQGRWSSLDDKKTFFQVEGDKQIDIYGHDILDTASINFYADCPGRTSPQDEKKRSGKYLVVQLKPDDFYCYSIDKLTSTQLTLTYLPKGSILRYKKVPKADLSTYNATDGDD